MFMQKVTHINITGDKNIFDISFIKLEITFGLEHVIFFLILT